MAIRISIPSIDPQFIQGCPSIEDYVDKATFETSLKNFTQAFIWNLFHTNHIGNLTHIELDDMSYMFEGCPIYYSASCRFNNLYDTPEARTFLDNIDRGGHHQMFYGDRLQRDLYVFMVDF